uniref:DOMON domain-containing protein n=1 Tax=Daphnia galeata TaxID=27404 RepID=A0A8J2RX99_9CRUS|nr:unnamed protein product [Daphnia galeata]
MKKNLIHNLILRWTVIEDTGDIEIEIQANCTGWTGISFVEGQIGTPGSYSDVIMGGFNDDFQKGYSEDRHIDLENPDPANGHFMQPGLMTVGWTYSSTDDTSLGHDTAGIGRVTFIPL